MKRTTDRRAGTLVSVGVATCAFALTVAAPARAGGEQAAPGSPGGELVDAVKTTRSRAEMSAFLVKPAEAAAAKRDWPHAIPMYEALVVARGPASAEARKLATLWTLAGQRDDAIRVLEAFAAATEDPTALRESQAEVARLEKTADPFANRFELAELGAEATHAFKDGRVAFRAKHYGDALVLYTMGYRLAPDLPGFLRELGATYDKLGARDKKLDFYREYLLRRPFGKNADEVRRDLAGDKSVLGSLSIASSLPCDQVWVNRQKMPGKLPKKGLKLAPGSYKGLCFNGKYEIALFQVANVAAGQTAEMKFDWAIIVNELKDPYGRISIENPESPGMMLDLGITSPEIGVAVPADGHALRMVLKDDGGTKRVERFIKLAPGQRQVVKW